MRRLSMRFACACLVVLFAGCATTQYSPKLDPADEQAARTFLRTNELVNRVVGGVESLNMVGYGRQAERNPLLFWRPTRHYSFFRIEVEGRHIDAQTFVKTRNLNKGAGWEVVQWGIQDSTYSLDENMPRIARAYLRQDERMLEIFGEIRSVAVQRHSAIHLFNSGDPTQGVHQLRLMTQVIGSDESTQVLVLLEEDEEGRWQGREAWLLSELDERIEEIRDIPL